MSSIELSSFWTQNISRFMLISLWSSRKKAVVWMLSSLKRRAASVLRSGLKTVNCMRNVNLESRSLFLPYKAVFFFSLSCTTKLNFQKPGLVPVFVRDCIAVVEGSLQPSKSCFKESNVVFLQPWIRCVCDVVMERFTCIVRMEKNCTIHTLCVFAH